MSEKITGGSGYGQNQANHPHQQEPEPNPPDWEYWGNITQGTSEELALLSLALSPSKTGCAIEQLHRATDRASLIDRELKPITGTCVYVCKYLVSDFRVWAASLNPPWELPPEFPRGGLPENPQPKPSPPEKSIGTRERNTLLVIIAALCKEANISIEKGKGGAEYIENITTMMGARVSADTIRTKLDDIRDAIEARQKT